MDVHIAVWQTMTQKDTLYSSMSRRCVGAYCILGGRAKWRFLHLFCGVGGEVTGGGAVYCWCCSPFHVTPLIDSMAVGLMHHANVSLQCASALLCLEQVRWCQSDPCHPVYTDIAWAGACSLFLFAGTPNLTHRLLFFSFLCLSFFAGWSCGAPCLGC